MKKTEDLLLGISESQAWHILDYICRGICGCKTWEVVVQYVDGFNEYGVDGFTFLQMNLWLNYEDEFKKLYCHELFFDDETTDTPYQFIDVKMPPNKMKLKDAKKTQCLRVLSKIMDMRKQFPRHDLKIAYDDKCFTVVPWQMSLEELMIKTDLWRDEDALDR